MKTVLVTLARENVPEISAISAILAPPSMPRPSPDELEPSSRVKADAIKGLGAALKEDHRKGNRHSSSTYCVLGW